MSSRSVQFLGFELGIKFTERHKLSIYFTSFFGRLIVGFHVGGEAASSSANDGTMVSPPAPRVRTICSPQVFAA